MDSRHCGKCTELVTGIEPAICGLCDTHYHIGRECSGISRAEMNNLFAKGAAIFVCPNCRSNFSTNNVLGIIKKLTLLESLETQVAELSQLVKELSRKIDDSSTQPFSFGATSQRSNPATGEWPLLKPPKRRRGANGETISVNSIPRPVQGTKIVDLSDLSVPNIIPEEPRPKFWLYLTGFHPQTSNDDITKIVTRSMDCNDAIDVVKLVPREADLSKLSFVSFKIGLNPTLKDTALRPSTWPERVKFREFQDFSRKSSSTLNPLVYSPNPNDDQNVATQ